MSALMLAEAFGWEKDAPLRRYLSSLGENWAWLLAAVVVAVGFALLTRARMPRGRVQSWGWALLGVVTFGALVHAWELRWLADDAFISFRYARNWVGGDGLVFNPGERVEGYTNFLWTLIAALVIAARLDPAQCSLLLSLACLGGALYFVTRLVRQLAPPDPAPIIPLAALLLAANYVFASYGTSGLETMAAALLVLVSLERARAGALLSAGCCGVGATLLHPDHVLFYGALGLALLSRPGRTLRGLMRYAAPFALGFVPYYLARWHYYGDFYPNTYYAKSGGLAYFSQGAVYLWVSGLAAGVVFALPLAVYGVYRLRRDLAGVFVGIAVPVYLAYVAKIGGDFMLGRLLVSVLPLIFVMAEVGARQLIARQGGFAFAVLGLVPFTLALMPQGVVKGDEKYLHVADERRFYRVKRFSPIVVDSGFTDQADKLMAAFSSAPRPPKLGVGCIGIVGWKSDYPIMDNWGLASRSVAHQVLPERGRPGHEKLAQPGHAFEGDVDFSDIEIWPERYAAWAKLSIGGWEFNLAKWDPALMKALRRKRGVEMPELERRLREYVPDRQTPTQVACDHWFFEQIYFRHQPAASLRAALVARFVNVEPALADVSALLLGAPAARDAKWKSRVLFAFDDLRGFTREGDAFADDPSQSEVPGQSRVFGHRGSFASSARRKRVDRAVGRLVSPPFTLRGEALTLLVAGGHEPGTSEVRLRVGERVVASATGCGSEVFGRRIWPIAAYRGQSAHLEIADTGSDAWQHILVDEVSEWERIP
jgi:arabinofuranosyltransferase